MVKRFRGFLTSFLPSVAESTDHEFAAVYKHTKTRKLGRSSKGSNVRRLVRSDVQNLSYYDLLQSIYYATAEVKGREMFRKTRCLPIGKRIFREHGAPFSFIDEIASAVHCVNNAAGYATDALLLYLTWQRDRRSKPDEMFNSYAFVSCIFSSGVRL